jgi:hypothetical protein
MSISVVRKSTGGGGSSTTVSNVTSTVTFTAEQSKDFDLTAFDVSDILRGRMYLSAYPGSDFYDAAVLTIYSHSDRKDHQAILMIAVPLVSTTLTGNANSGTNVLAVTTANQIITNDLLYCMGSTTEFRRVEFVSGNNLYTFDNLDNNHVTSDGVSNVAEFAGQTVWDDTSAGKIWCRLSFSAPRTCSIKIDVKARG